MNKILQSSASMLHYTYIARLFTKFVINVIFVLVNKQIMHFRNYFLLHLIFATEMSKDFPHIKCHHTLHNTLSQATFCLPTAGLPDLTCSISGMTSNETQRLVTDCVFCWFS